MDEKSGEIISADRLDVDSSLNFGGNASDSPKKYPKFRISSIYDFLECEKRFYLIETGKTYRRVTGQMMRGQRDHAGFEQKIMALPEAFEIIDLRDGFLKACEFGKPVVSSEIPVKMHDHDFQLFVSGKIDGIVILPLENTIKIIENKPRLSEYALAQGLLYGYTVRRILSEFSPKIVVEIRNTKSQEVFSDKAYEEYEEQKAKYFLERISLILNNKINLDDMKRCSLPDCACRKIWW